MDSSVFLSFLIAMLALLPFVYFAVSSTAEVIHYPPANTSINNLDLVISGSGAPGIYNSSQTPDAEYGTYNWCNMPHVRAREYKQPPSQYKLVYVEVIQRHHKRTPYASNTFFKEDTTWDCTNSGPIAYAKSDKSGTSKDVSEIQWKSYRDPQNPWSTSVGPGFVGSNCQFPQITPEGLEDSHTHGADLKSVYIDRLHLFGPNYNPQHVQFRVTNNVITSQVAGALVRGLFPKLSLNGVDTIQTLIQPSGIDSLEPQYPCSKANNIRNEYTTGSANWTVHLDRASSLYDRLDRVSGTERRDTAGWHTNFDHYYDNLSAKQCHGKNLPCSVNDTNVCVTQEDANAVYRLGNWEYSYQYRDAPGSALYGALKFGGWMLELKAHLQTKASSKNDIRYFHNVAHDGSISSLLAFLQIDQMVWPGMGSEVVFELYSYQQSHYVRVLWSGQVMKTSTPLGHLNMIPLKDFIAYIDGMVGSGSELLQACRA